MSAVRCPECQASTSCAADAREFVCGVCGHRFGFVQCDACEACAALALERARSDQPWPCRWCGAKNRGPGAVVVVANDLEHERLKWELLDAEDGRVPVTAGFVVTDGAGLGLPAGARCTTFCTRETLQLWVEPRGPRVELPHTDLTAIEFSGAGAGRTGRRFVGGGYGFTDAIVGTVGAGALNALTNRGKVDTTVTIRARQGEVVLQHDGYTGEQLRVQWQVAFSAMELQRRASAREPAVEPAGQLERLVRLRDAGAITEAEFETARATFAAGGTDAT
jgi:hypothetical protein